jgi:hypothetical protein
MEYLVDSLLDSLVGFAAGAVTVWAYYEGRLRHPHHRKGRR